MIEIQKINLKTYKLLKDDQILGTISTYRNLFHDTCIYLKFNLNKYPASIPFSQIYQQEQKPLQVMTESTNINLVNCLLHNGFTCKRRCYEAQVDARQLAQPLESKTSIFTFDNRSSIYSTCCSFLYQYYKEMHAPVSPLTTNEETFIAEVPTKSGFYSLNEQGNINHLAFTENNEIAYICSNDPTNCPYFINSLLTQMFNKYKEIFFEADDTDWAATMLLEKFTYAKNSSFNTYIWQP